jgi:hypothetical protein
MAQMWFWDGTLFDILPEVAVVFGRIRRCQQSDRRDLLSIWKIPKGMLLPTEAMIHGCLRLKH